MVSSNSLIPQAFDSSVYRALESFETMLFFRWDFSTDKIEFSTEMTNIPYCLPETTAYISNALLLNGLLHSADILTFENFLNRIFFDKRSAIQNPAHTVTELRLLSADKKSFIWSELKLLVYFDGTIPQTAFGSIRNIHKQKEQQLSLLREAEHDPLTGFLNKGAIQQHIGQYLERITPNTVAPALLIIDADGFKDINDNFGHLFGDAVLTDMAMEIEHQFRHTDILGRIGGDEFIVLFRELPSLELLKQRCQQLIDNLHRSYKNGNEALPFSISIGIALYPEHGRTYDELFKHADRALYESKRQGKNMYSIYKPSFLNQSTQISSRDTTNSADLQQKAFKDNMIEFIFRLLYETKNPEATIAITLSMLGKQFNFDRVAISTFSRLNNSYQTAFEWLSPYGLTFKHDEHDLEAATAVECCNQAIQARYKPTAWGMMSICEDTRTLAPAEAAAFEHFHIRSFAYNKIARGSEDLGSIAFTTAAAPHTYSEEEFTYLNIFSSLLGNILLGDQTDALLSQQNKRLMDIIDHMQEMIYVVDKDSFELLFFNQTIRQALPEVSIPQTCYYRFHKLDKPCPNCPVQLLSDNGAEYIIRSVDCWGFPANSKAFNINWLPGRRTSLIIMEP